MIPLPKEDRSRAYARLRRLLWLAELVLTAGFLVLLLASGASATLEQWVQERFSAWPAAVVVYAGILGAARTLIGFPLDWLRGFRLEHRFGLSTQTFRAWLKDYAKQVALGGALGLLLVETLSGLLRAAPATWWIWAAILWLLWSVILTRLAPTLLIPIFYQQRPLRDAALRQRLESFLARCGVRVDGLFELNLSRTTTKANACLTGLGKSRRVLLADTLASRYPPEEVETVLAHEIGHHRLHHIGILIGTSAVATFLSCFGVDRLARGALAGLGLTALSDLAALPLIGLSLFAANLILMPAVNGISRRLEAQADRFALDETGNPAAFIAAMRRLAGQNLAELAPPRWVEWLLHDHPSLARRIAMAQQYSDSKMR